MSEASHGQGYLALARRHRPTQFEQVIGQEHVTRTLANAIRAERVHHAYLFTGSRGVGKTTIARILARALNCEKGPTPTPCGECDACRDGGFSTDVFEIDGASHTGVDDIRELRENVRYLPSRARYKIYIIDEVHMLSTSAFNALLKTLEEPPPHVVFVFATTEPHKIPATILSRCQRFDFKRVALPVLIAHLERLLESEQISVGAGGLSLIARAGEGSVRDSLSLLDLVIAYGADGEQQLDEQRVAEIIGVADRRTLFRLSAAVLAGETKTALQLVAELFGQGLDLAQFAQGFLAHLRDLVVVKTCNEPGELVDASEAEVAELAAQVASVEALLLQQHFERFADAAEEIARSAFPRLVLEMILIELCQAEPMLPLGDLLERLEQMERRLGSTGGGRSAAPQGGGGAARTPGGAGVARSQPSSQQARPAESRSAPTSEAPASSSSSRSAPPLSEASAPVVTARGPAVAPPVVAPPVSAPPVAASPAAPSTSVAAPVAAPAPTLAAAQGDLLTRWRTLLRRVEQHDPLANNAFLSGHLLAWQNDRLELGFTKDSFELARAADREKQARFVKACEQAIGRTIEVVVRELTETEENSDLVQRASAERQQAREQKAAVDALRDEARAHPMTRAMVEMFSAEITEISVQKEQR